MNENFIVFWLMLCVMVSAAFSCGVVLGFGGFLAYVAGCVLVAWLYGALVVNRPRVQPARAFVGTYLGYDFYTEVA